MKRRIMELDVFGRSPLSGNPLAVVLDAEGLTTEQMQAFASWINYSETTFVGQTPAADYALRIFTPRAELPFAGHPSVGTAWALHYAGALAREKTAFVQSCAAGLLPVRADWAANVVSVRTPDPVLTPLVPAQLAALAAALGGARCDLGFHVNVGARWLVLPLESAEQVLSLRPDFAALATACGTAAVGLTIYARSTDKLDGDVEVRSFAPADGINEDPVCGSGNAAVAAVRRALGDFGRSSARYLARQGRACGRDGEITIQVEAEQGAIEIGGSARLIVEGTVEI